MNLVSGEPCYVQRDAVSVIAVVAATDDNLLRLRRLQCDGHSFDVYSQSGTYVFCQNQPQKVGLNVLDDKPNVRQQLTHRDCRWCNVADTCLGPSSVMFPFSSDDMAKPQNQMRMSMINGACRAVTAYECDVSVNGRALTLTNAALRDAGFDPISRVSYFLDVYDKARDLVAALESSELSVSSPDDVRAAARAACIDINKIAGGMFFMDVSKSGIDDLLFDRDHVSASLTWAAARSTLASEKAAAVRDYQQSTCADCIHECSRSEVSQRMRYDYGGHCRTTLASVVERSTYDDDKPDHRLALALYGVTGYNGVYVADTGRARQGVSRRVFVRSDGVYVEIVAASDPHTVISVMTAADYAEKRGLDMDARVADMVASTSVDTRKVAFSALDRLSSMCRRRVAFRYDGEGRNHVNDIYFLRTLGADLSEIVIGSDSRAKTHGGRQFRGNNITVDERPRFKTYYQYPFFDAFKRRLSER